MKKLLLLVFVLNVVATSAMAQGQKVLTEVDLTVNGVRSGTSYARVIRALGKPLRQTDSRELDECANGYERVLRYPGLTVTLMSDERRRNHTVIALEVTSPRWTIAPGVKIGASMKVIRSKYGRPHDDAEATARNELWYVTKENLGGVTFTFRRGRLVRVWMGETLC